MAAVVRDYCVGGDNALVALGRFEVVVSGWLGV